MYIIGIDNGATGSICGLYRDDYEEIVGDFLFKTPTKSAVDYHTGRAKNISRLNVHEFLELFNSILERETRFEIYLEKPFTGPCEKQASVISGARVFEAQLACFDYLGIDSERIHVIPATKWQKVLLPAGKQDTKTKAFNVASRLYPELFKHIDKKKVKSGKDYMADAVMIAHYGMLEYE